MDNHVKILFRFYSDILDQDTVETMWATVVDLDKGLYKIGSIPFYKTSIAIGDIVFAEFDEDEEMLTYREAVEYSDDSTIMIILMDKDAEINGIRKLFSELGCPSERFSEKYFSMQIPSNINYKSVKDVLIGLEEKETIGYAEGCLSDKHRNEL